MFIRKHAIAKRKANDFLSGISDFINFKSFQAKLKGECENMLA